MASNTTLPTAAEAAVMAPALANVALLVAAPQLGCLHTYIRTLTALYEANGLSVPDLSHVMETSDSFMESLMKESPIISRTAATASVEVSTEDQEDRSVCILRKDSSNESPAPRVIPSSFRLCPNKPNKGATNNKPHFCKNCDHIFQSNQALRKHLVNRACFMVAKYLTEAEKGWKCIQCDKQLNTLTTAKRHALSHNNKLGLKCPVCEEYFRANKSCDKNITDRLKHVEIYHPKYFI